MSLINKSARRGWTADHRRTAGIGLALGIALLLTTGSATAQVFKWVGADGKTNYSDIPPPPTAMRAQKKSFAGNVVDDGDLPYSLSEVAKTSPVTLYTGAKCLPCDEGRKLLDGRGIPFTEKTVASNPDIALLGTGTVELPQLAVGSTKLRGFEASAWNASLSTAGYPESNRLPKSYRNPPPQSAAPASRDSPTVASSDTADGMAASKAATGRRATRNLPKPPEANPAGIRF